MKNFFNAIFSRINIFKAQQKRIKLINKRTQMDLIFFSRNSFIDDLKLQKFIPARKEEKDQMTQIKRN